MTAATYTERESDQYNGWRNYGTWNVALYVGNEEPLYRIALRYVKGQQASWKEVAWDEFLRYAGIDGRSRTPDGIPWGSRHLDREELAEMLMELED